MENPTEFMNSGYEAVREQLVGKRNPQVAMFYWDAERDEKASELEKAPVYKRILMVLVGVLGERDRISRAVESDDKLKFRDGWEHFQKMDDKPPAIPLGALPKMTPEIRKALEELGITSTSQLAETEVPGYLNQWKEWAVQVKGIHDVANGAAKPRYKLVAA
jgi:hypothetical protein